MGSSWTESFLRGEIASEAPMTTLQIKPQHTRMTWEQLLILIGVIVFLGLFLAPAFIAAFE